MASLEQRISEYTAGWPAERKADLIAYLRAQHTRETMRARYAHPAQLAAAVDPAYVVTPAVNLISRSIERVLREPRRNLLVTMPPQEGKLVDAHAPVPTPDGWRKHGDLRPGDAVFHPSGKTVQVTVKYPDDVADRRVHFTDHTYVDVHRYHEWTVWDRSRGAWRTMETADMERRALSSGKPGRRGHRYCFHLPHREAVHLPEADLPIDPYTLGVWLGDGTASKPAVTHHPDDTYGLAYPVTSTAVHKDTGVVTDYYGGGMRRDLRMAGLLGAKHVPDAYLRASAPQRRALLAGLIDSDGCVSGTQTSFDNADRGLVEAVAELARSLGYRAHVHSPTPATVSTTGIHGRRTMWRCTFSPHDEAPARLARKVDKFIPAARRRVAISRIEVLDTPGTGNCITVDSPDGLYLVGEGWTPTHNSSLCAVWAPLRALQLSLDTRIILATYGDALAEEHSAAARGIITAHGTGAVDSITGRPVEDRLGLSLQDGSTKVSRWRVEGGHGGVAAVGIGSAITGRAADLMIIDDPFKNMQEADSAAHRRKVLEWYRSVALTRLSPNASVILIQTRWHPDDLAGEILAAESEVGREHQTWRHINIPAVSEDGVPDALGREPGTAMESARGRTPADFAATRRAVGERVWYALYQGVPAPVEGGLFARDWFDRHRLDERPEHPAAVVIGIDPAETGEDDEAGVVAAALLDDGTVALTHDRSGHMTSDEWARAAVALALETGAVEVAFEAYSTPTTYQRILRDTFTAMRREASSRRRNGEDLSAVDRRIITSAAPPFRIKPWRGKGDAVARSASLRRDLEVGQARVTGAALAVLEEQAAEWQDGQHQPDRVAAAIIAHDRARALGPGAGRAGIASPARPTAGRAGGLSWASRTI